MMTATQQQDLFLQSWVTAYNNEYSNEIDKVEGAAISIDCYEEDMTLYAEDIMLLKMIEGLTPVECERDEYELGSVTFTIQKTFLSKYKIEKILNQDISCVIEYVADKYSYILDENDKEVDFEVEVINDDIVLTIY
ncbi:MAG: hypothetical protein GY679_01470 [Mycoplasma sp.]|nr:hypothetical protein [Mycoplasma sp.]